MNGPSKLSLAIALALIGGNAFALGLGSIQVKSGLNQPLDAEIALTTDAPGEASGINVGMATAEDFDRVGLNRTRVAVPIDFAVSTNSRGQAVIKLTTKDAVREPFLDFLIQVNWPKGKLLREYTVLLDPPITAPGTRGPATVSAAKEASAAPAQKLVVEEKQSKTKTTSVKPPKVAAEPKQPPAPKPTPAPKATPSTAARAPSAGDYGPVAEGETLSEVARATRPDESTNINQMMLALLKANPNAFYKDNINALKRGAILRIPSGEEMKATGNAAAAAAAVHEQNDSWTSGAAVAKPTVVANAGAPKSTAAPKPDTKTSAKPSEHLALVPPRAGKESSASADRPGPSGGTSAGGDSKAELTRTKEALASREQEATELKSRVKQLEDLNGKDQRLLSLKESEIADLQAKLKELQSKASSTTPATAATKPGTTPTATAPATTTTTPATTATTTPATTTPSTTAATPAKPGDTKLTAQDIWGNIAATEKAGTKPATPGATSTTTPATSTSSTSTPSTSTSTTPTTTSTTPSTTASSTSTTAPTTPPGTTTPSTTGSTTPSTTGTSSTTPSTTPGTTPSATATPPAGTTVTPITTPATTSPTAISSTAPSTTPVKPTTPAVTPKPVTPPPVAEQPWYQNNTVLLGGGVGLLLIGLLTLMRFMRKPKPVLMPVEGGELEEQALVTGDEEHHLLDALAQSPGDAHLSLELLNLYYQQRDAAKFEAAAEAMYAHIADPTQPEWQQVKAMGEELCPHNPLFSGGDIGLGGTGHRQEHTVFGHYDTGTAAAQDDPFDLGGHAGHDAKHTAAEENFDFDLTDHAAAAPAPAHDFTHEPPPPVTVRAPVHTPAPVHHAPAPAAVPAPKPAEDFFAGEDAIGTKLDLAKAYLDMGDPEGARSMLDEVMSEGNDAQKGEARKLLAEIR